jgi:hypothetical protein
MSRRETPQSLNRLLIAITLRLSGTHFAGGHRIRPPGVALKRESESYGISCTPPSTSRFFGAEAANHSTTRGFSLAGILHGRCKFGLYAYEKEKRK